ncbi:MAG: lipid A export permease/ATP-binding protein MsbA [Pseudomonadota bacterium]
MSFKESNGQMNRRQIYLRLLGYVKPRRRAFGLAILCMVFSSIMEPAFPALLKYLLDDGFSTNSNTAGWLIYPIALFAIFALRAIAGYFADYLMAWVSQHVIATLRREMFAHLLKLPTRFYGEQASGRLLSRMAYDVTGVANASTHALTNLVKDSVSVIGLLGWLIFLNWRLTLITVAIIPFIALVVRYFSKRIRHFSRGIQTSQGAITQVLQEAIESQKIIKVFCGQLHETQRFDKVVEEQRRLQMRSMSANAALGPVVQLFVVLALVIIMAIALYQAAAGMATVGDFISFITATIMMLAPLKSLSNVNASIQRGLVAAESVFSLIDENPEDDHGVTELGRAQGLVEFSRVSFRYPGAQQNAVAEFNLIIRPGECIALVGPSGSGKTTVANLLPRFYHVNAGTIRIDDIPIEDIKLSSLRDNIALVSQEIVLFNDTLAANIAYGCVGAVSRAEIVAAATAAHAMEFIERLPEGLDSLVGERGVKLSGGQRQRIAIARALLKNAPILVLDEATSALDNESERQVQAALDLLMVGRATLVIAHRLSTIERATRILVMEQGRKVEEGTHESLLASDGVYARLYRNQQAIATGMAK